MEQLNSENNVAVLLNLLQQPMQEQLSSSPEQKKIVKPNEVLHVEINAREVVATLNLLKHTDEYESFDSLSQGEVMAFITKIDRECASIDKKKKELKTSCMTEKQIAEFRVVLEKFETELMFYKSKLENVLSNRISA